MAQKELTLKEIAEHNTKKDLYLVIHEKVYDCSRFVDEHPYVYPTYTDPTYLLQRKDTYTSINA